MTLQSHVDKINSGDNVIIGLGDSFTQGLGAYDSDVWSNFSKPASMHNISGQFHTDEQGKNNWLRQITEKFLPNYKCMNLGINGAGNRAAIKELYLNPLPSDVGNVIVVLLATGIERFDFLKNEKITSGAENHQKWRTVWPTIDSNRGSVAKLEKEYAMNVWSPKTDAMEFLMNIAEAQEFCRSRNYKFVFGSAFDNRINENFILKELKEDVAHWMHLVDWKNFISPAGCSDFLEYTRKLENHPQVVDFYDGRQYCSQLDMPLRYITPCYHWTIEGNYEIAKCIFNILKDKNLV
jgi:hypothetical protein